MHQGTVNNYQPNPPFELHTDSHTVFVKIAYFRQLWGWLSLSFYDRSRKSRSEASRVKSTICKYLHYLRKGSINWSKRTFFEFEDLKLPRLWRVQLRIQISTSKKGTFGEPLWLKGKAILYIARFSNRYIIVKVFRKRFGYLVRTLQWVTYLLRYRFPQLQSTSKSKWILNSLCLSITFKVKYQGTKLNLPLDFLKCMHDNNRFSFYSERQTSYFCWMVI